MENNCIQALYQCHLSYSNRNKTLIDSNLEKKSCNGSEDGTSGPCIAKRFAEEATKILSPDEMTQLIEFLKGQAGNCRTSNLEETLAHRLLQFYETEPEQSQQSVDRLTIPGGPAHADFGILLHIRSDKGTQREFWNPASATISLLEEKGITKDFAFGFDWHWRAEDGSYLSRSSCPLHKWPDHLKQVHNQLSADILEILPLPFVATASGCTKSNIRKTLTSDTKSLEIFLSETSSISVDLDFRKQVDTHQSFLRRLIIHVHHPSSGFLSTEERRETMGTQIDAGLNFLLWLTGKAHNIDAFRRAYSESGPAGKRPFGKRPAPLAEMYAYIKQERREERILGLSEYKPSFLSWVMRYLLQEPTTILAQGHSVAEAALLRIRENMKISSVNRPPREPKKRKAPEDGNYSPDTLFHGRPVTVLQSGAVKLTSTQFTLLFRMGTKAAKEILALKDEVRIYFTPDEVILRARGRSVYQKPIERLIASVNGEEWIVQITNELNAIHQDKQSKNLDNKTGDSTVNISAIPHDPRLGARWKNGELRRKLINGSIFPCTEMSNAAKVGRVYFRGVQLYIPQEADYDSVWIQCDLAAPGVQHPNMTPSECVTGDPAMRLGIKVRFREKGNHSNREYWAALKGSNNTKILNSLVDFLEGKDEEWTENQPRRYLSRCEPRGRKKVSYTS